MAHFDLSQISLSVISPLTILRGFADTFAFACELNKAACEAMNRGETGEELHQSLVRVLRNA